MKRYIFFILVFLGPYSAAWAQHTAYTVDWYKKYNCTRGLYVGSYLTNGDSQKIILKTMAICNIPSDKKSNRYDGHLIDTIGRIHHCMKYNYTHPWDTFTGGHHYGGYHYHWYYDGYGYALNINKENGELLSALRTENMYWPFYWSYGYEIFNGNGDSVIAGELDTGYYYFGSVPNGVCLYFQTRDNEGHFCDKRFECSKNIRHFFIVFTDDKEHVYALFRAHNTGGSVQIGTHSIIINHQTEAAYILGCFDLKGNYVWARDIFDEEIPSSGTWDSSTIKVSCIANENGQVIVQIKSLYAKGYFNNTHRVIGDNSQFSRSDYQSLLVRISATGQWLNEKFFDSVDSSNISPLIFNGKDHFYFKIEVRPRHPTPNAPYVFNNFGYTFNADKHLNAYWYDVFGEMDTNFNIVWHKLLPILFTDGYINYIKFNSSSTHVYSCDTSHGDLVILAFRINKIYLDNERKNDLYKDFKDTTSINTILRFSKDKGFEVLYQLGHVDMDEYTDTAHKINLEYISPFFFGIGSIVADSNNDFYVYCVPYDYPYNPYIRGCLIAGGTLICKISPLIPPDSVYGHLECNGFYSKITYHSLPDSVQWLWGDGDSLRQKESCQDYTDGKITIGEAFHRYADTGHYWLRTISWIEGHTYNDSFQVFVKYRPLPSNPLPDTVRICPGSSYLYHIHRDSSLDYTWPNGSHDSFFAVNSPQTVLLHISNTICDTAYSSIVIFIDTSYHYAFSPAQIKAANGIVLHLPQDIGIPTWPDGSHTYDYHLNMSDTGLLKLTITDSCHSYNTFLRIEPLCPVYAPNVFHPGSAIEQNNYWQPVSPCGYREYHLTIYNRWGERVFQSNDPQESWDGGGCQEGVYYYMLIGRMSDGRNIFLKGNITLVR